ncbi:MAG: NAD-dependent epimerase/dehydratase family protein [Gemmatimonadota bacterium]
MTPSTSGPPVPQDAGVVLVTGATGFVGRYLLPLLLTRGYEVRGTYRGKHAPRDFPSAIEWVSVPDVGPATEWSEALDGITQVVHLSGIAHRYGSRGALAQEEFYRVNQLGTRKLASDVAAGSDIQRFVFLSSVGAICSLSDTIVNAETPASPDTHYGKSKLAGEREVSELLNDPGGPDWCVLRSPLVYGPGNPGNMGRLLRLIDRGVPMPLASISNRRSFIFIGNLADAIENCLSDPAASRRTFLLADGEDVSTSELVRRLSEHASRPVRVFPMPGRMLRLLGRIGDGIAPLLGRSVGLSTYAVERLMGSLQVDSSGIKSALDWRPPFSLDEGLSQTLGTRPTTLPDAQPMKWRFVWGKGVAIDGYRPDPGPVKRREFLVTGAGGFVAPHLLTALVAGGHSVRGLVRERLPNHDVRGVKYVEGDITDRASVSTALVGVDTVIHLAGRAHVLDERDPNGREAFFRTNVDGTRIVTTAALEEGVERFLFLSSVKALGEVGGDVPWTGSTEPQPAGPYGESKLAAEQVIRELTEGTGLHAPILRFPILYGPGVKANLLRLFELVARGVPLPLGRVKNLRSLLYVENAVAAMEAALGAPEAAQGTYLVNDLQDLSTPDLVRAIGGALGRRARIISVPVALFKLGGSMGDLVDRAVPSPLTTGVVERLVGSLRVDATEFVAETGYTPPFSVQEGLRRTATWFRKEVR